MAYIKVNHKKLGQTATAIDTYVTNHTKKMTQIDREITGLKSSWQGADYNQVKFEWKEMQEGDSTSGNMLKALKSYAEYLRYAENKYKEAQSKAVNRANRLPKY